MNNKKDKNIRYKYCQEIPRQNFQVGSYQHLVMGRVYF